MAWHTLALSMCLIAISVVSLFLSGLFYGNRCMLDDFVRSICFCTALDVETVIMFGIAVWLQHVNMFM
jgi:hypothetical protein